MVEVLSQTFWPIMGHIIKIENFLNEVGKIFFCHVINELVENLEEPLKIYLLLFIV